jgi:anti-sigma B factor antagonist
MSEVVLHTEPRIVKPSCGAQQKTIAAIARAGQTPCIITMPINSKPSGDGVELFLAGRVDGAMANELEVAILEAIRTGTKALYVNMAEATFLCSAGLRVLLQYWRQMKNGGKQFHVTSPSPEVNSVLAMTGFREQMVEGAQQR